MKHIYQYCNEQFVIYKELGGFLPVWWPRIHWCISSCQVEVLQSSHSQSSFRPGSLVRPSELQSQIQHPGHCVPIFPLSSQTSSSRPLPLPFLLLPLLLLHACQSPSVCGSLASPRLGWFHAPKQAPKQLPSGLIYKCCSDPTLWHTLWLWKRKSGIKMWPPELQWVGLGLSKRIGSKANKYKDWIKPKVVNGDWKYVKWKENGVGRHYEEWLFVPLAGARGGRGGWWTDVEPYVANQMLTCSRKPERVLFALGLDRQIQHDNRLKTLSKGVH